MGLKGGTKACWNAKGVSLSDIKQIHRTRVNIIEEQEDNKNDAEKLNIRLDVDVPILLHSTLVDPKYTYLDVLSEVAKKLDSYAELGFEVNPILDGVIKPDCKRVSWRRRTEKLINLCNSLYCRQKLMAMGGVIDNAESSNENQIKEKMNALNKEATRLDSASRFREILPTIKEDLDNKLFEIGAYIPKKPHGGVVNECIMSLFQADSMMVYRVHNRDTDYILTTDSDSQMYLRPCDFFIKKCAVGTNGKETTFDLCGTSNALMTKLKECVSHNERIVWSEVKYPIFDFDNPPLRSYVGITLGCDVYMKGVAGVGQDEIWSFMKKQNFKTLSNHVACEKMIDFILCSSAKKTNMTQNDLIALSSAILFEPAVDYGKCKHVSEWKYMYGRPQYLPKYVEYFRHPEDNTIPIVDTTPMYLCAGNKKDNNHALLASEGMHQCCMCQTFSCSTCCYHPNFFSKSKISGHEYFTTKPPILCMTCYKKSSTARHVSGDDGKYINETPLHEMLTYLRKRNININKDDIDLCVVQELYEDAIASSSPYWSYEASMPVHKSEFIDPRTPFYTGQFANGAVFLQNTDVMRDTDILGIVRLLAAFVTYKGVNSCPDLPFVSTMPSFIIDFANKSRKGIADTAYKVIKSCQRTVNDPTCPSMISESFSLFRDENGDISILVGNNVSASMRKQNYYSKVALTRDKLLATKCTCRFGGKNSNDRILCTHNLPLVMGIALLLYDGLAQHFLMELASRWNSNLERLVKSENVFGEIRNDLKALMRAARVDEFDITRYTSLPSITEILELYDVGTEKSKVIFKPKPTPKECYPIRLLKWKSNDRLLQDRINAVTTTNTDDENDSTDKQDRDNSKNKKQDCINGLPEERANTEKSDSCNNNDCSGCMPRTFVPQNLLDMFDSEEKINSETSATKSTPESDDDTYCSSSANEENNREYIVLEKDVTFQSDVNYDFTTERVNGNKKETVCESRVTDTFSSSELNTSVSSLSSSKNNNVSKESTDPFLPQDDWFDDEALNSLLEIDDKSQLDDIDDSKAPKNESSQKDCAISSSLQLSANSISDGIKVSQKSMNSLSIGKWLDDEVINFIYDLFRKEHSFCHGKKNIFFTCFFMSALLQDRNHQLTYCFDRVKEYFNREDLLNAPDDTNIYIPLNITNTHWALLVACLGIKGIFYYDSLTTSTLPNKYQKALLQFLKDFYNDNNMEFDESKWNFHNFGTSIPQQTNGDDCGVFTLINTYLLVNNLPLAYTQDGLYNSRSRSIISACVRDSKLYQPILLEPTGSQPDFHSNQSRDLGVIHACTQKVPTKKVSKKESKPTKRKKDKQKEVLQEKEQGSVGLEEVELDMAGETDFEMPTFDPVKPDYIRMSKLILSLPYKKNKNEALGIRLVHLRAQSELKNKKVSEKYMSVIRRDISFLLRSANDKTNDKSYEVSGNILRHESPPILVRKKKRKYCVYPGCKNTDATHTLQRVNICFLEKKNPTSKVSLERYHGKRMFRKELRSRLGISQKKKTKDIRMCYCHGTEEVTKTIKVPYGSKGRVAEFSYGMILPLTSGVGNASLTRSRGTGSDRLKMTILKNVGKNNECCRSWINTVIALTEHDSPSKKRGLQMNDRLANQVGDGIGKLENKRQKVSYNGRIKKRKERKVVRLLENMNDSEIHRLTGFKSIRDMMVAIIVMSNGELEKIITTKSPLTWFEEWMLLFEVLWGRIWHRWQDVASEFDLTNSKERLVFDGRLRQILDVRAGWPMYCSLTEDELLQDDKWKIRGEQKRYVFWDTTNISFRFKPSTALNQRQTYNPYYGGPCAKGGVLIQKCGWVNVHHLFVGGISDSLYQVKSGIFEMQRDFAKSDLINKDVHIPFVNILDRGYRVTEAAWRCGNQTVLQPVFMDSDRVFSTADALYSAAIASDRAGNERAVKISKESGFLKKGVHSKQNLERLDNVWLAWSFLQNFMRLPVM